MSYIKTEWNSGDVITAEKLNKLENGVAESGAGGDNGPLIVRNADNNNWRVDTSFNQIKAAVDAGRPVIYVQSYGDGSEYGYSYMMFSGLEDNNDENYSVHFGNTEVYSSDPDEIMSIPD